MRHTLTFAAVALLLIPSSAVAQDPPGRCAEWAAGPVGFLLTEGERVVCEGLAEAAATAGMVELFWVRRDPDLSTRANEVREEMELRIAAADERFGEEDLRGALTDRGRTLILLGPPAERSRGPAGEYLARVYGSDETAWGGGVRTRRGATTVDPARGEAEIWVYRRDQIPDDAGLGSRDETLTIAYVDPRGDGVFAFDRAHPEWRVVQRVLATMPQLLAPNLGLEEVPSYPLIDGGAAATAAQLAWLDGSGWPEGAVAVSRVGVGLAQQRPAWVFVRLPLELPVADLAVLRMVGSGGTEEGTLAIPVDGLPSARGTVYELRIPEPVEGGTVALALAREGAPVAAGSVPLPAAAGEPPFITEIMAGAELSEHRDYKAGDPFIFGGYHLLLRPEGRYRHDENLAYFCLAAVPSAEEGSPPSARVRMRIRHGGKVIYQPQPREVALSSVAPGVYMFGSQLPLDALPEAGQYDLMVRLELLDGGASREVELPIVIEEVGP